MKILIKYPTRGRPELFKQTFGLYRDLASKDGDIKFLISADNNDPTMNNEEMRTWLAAQPNTLYYFGDSKSKIQAVNADMDKAGDWDIVLLASDDMKPMVREYDKAIVDNMKEHFPDGMGLLHFSDGLAKQALCTLTIIGRKLYEHFGYLYHPDYESLWADNELDESCVALGAKVYIDNVIIKHDWVGHTVSDSLHHYNEKFNARDKLVYQKRKEMGFPVDKSCLPELSQNVTFRQSERIRRS